MVVLDRCGSVTAIGARARDLKKSAESAGSMCDTPQARHSNRNNSKRKKAAQAADAN
jgi:hypothetical protein